MNTFLFEQYGYYPGKLENNSFNVDGWDFKLIKVELSDNELDQINEYLEYVRKCFDNKGAFIVKNRNGKLASYYDNNRYVLVSIQNVKITLEDFNAFHCSFLEKEKTMDLNNLVLVWKERLELVENECMNSLRIDSVYYKENFEISLYALGLAQNALQYLSECVEIYGPKLEGLTLTHKRINEMNSFSFFNPFNFIVDHPVRDLSELYKNNCVEYSQLIDLLEYYRLDERLASLMMARVLYPCKVFDLLENNFNVRDTNLKFNYSIEKEFVKLKKIYRFLRNQYQIRPIIWLE